MLSRFKLSTRILILGIAIVAAFSALFCWLYPRIKDNMYDAKYLKTRHLVETAYSMVANYADAAGKGQLSPDAARKQAIEAIRSMRYGQGDYFWINDMVPRMIMHPMKPELNGRDLSGVKDANNKYLFNEFVAVCRKDGAGFVDYMWPKPGELKPQPKISYVKLFSQWNWVIGSGIYIDDVEKEIAGLFTIIFAAVSVIMICAIAISWMMSRSIAGPIDTIIKSLNIGSDEISLAAGHVSRASQSLAQGASEQAAGIEKTTASLEELASMTCRNARSADQTNSLMSSTNTVINQAMGQMEALTKSMGEISNASEETQNIVKTIDEIAFQTNLLALNAAVEAARAGETGAGFAVVADEVRNLAIRAAEAAKNTSKLIEDTVGRVHDGTESVSKTSSAFKEVAEFSVKISELVEEIASASSEQNRGVEKISKAATKMDQVVQENAASAEESAAASEELNAQAEQMKQMVREMVLLIEGR